LNSLNYTVSEKFALIKDYIDGLRSTITHDDFDEHNMHELASPTCNYYERGTMLWMNMITYGATGPSVVRQGGDHVAQRAEAMKQHDGMTLVVFT
jgi:hypothetical protein